MTEACQFPLITHCAHGCAEHQSRAALCDLGLAALRTEVDALRVQFKSTGHVSYLDRMKELAGRLVETERDNTTLRRRLEEQGRVIERVKAALEYAGIGTPYPHNRLERLLQDKAASSTNADDGMFWRAVYQRLKAALSPTTEPPEEKASETCLCPPKST